MYWNHTTYLQAPPEWLLNSNIRCIEMGERQLNYKDMVSWIVTLDVLKFKFRLLVLLHRFQLNSNIRCIEIKVIIFSWHRLKSWIVTLDVLKFVSAYYKNSSRISWIVTLDVLKFIRCNVSIIAVQLNSNIRCIEIRS